MNKNKLTFTRLTEEGRIRQVQIIPPYEEEGRFSYFYPDGIKSGFFRKKYFFVKDNITRKLFESPGEVKVEGGFVKEGKIYFLGELFLYIDGIPDPVSTKYQDSQELKTLLDSLSDFWGLSPHSFLSIDTSKTQSLYEYKETLA